MHFSNILAGLALASTVIAVPTNNHYKPKPKPKPKPHHPKPQPHQPAGPGCQLPSATPSASGPSGPGATSTPGTPDNSTDESLYMAMQAAGREFIGTAVTLRNETAEPLIISQEFNSMTPENAMKWESTEPTRGNFTFADADRHVAFAKENDLEIHCHTLVWHSQLPQWVSQGGFSNETLIQVMEDHIAALVTRWKGACTRWDVVNEALNENGTYRSSVWYDTIGEAFIPIAFKLVRKYDENVQLFYNDYNLEFNAEKTAGAARIVKLIQSYGIEINGVGYQGHVTSESTPTAPGPAPEQSVLEAALRATADLGVNVVYTEIDVRTNTPVDTESEDAQVATWKRMAASCLAVESCIGMTVWGISDKYSWIPGVFAGEGSALLWDENYEKKPSYYGFLEGITE